MKKCHFIGIGGIGMSGLARLALHKNISVTGSDIASSYVTEALEKAGVQVYVGHSASYITPDTTVVYCTGIKDDNPEYRAALELKCPMLHRSELLQQLMSAYRSLAIAGTHGKTTTSSILTWVLETCGQSPSYAIGGVIPQLSSNAGHGNGDYFVAEACESDGTFLNYTPFGAIVTNIDLDHMDHYVTEKSLLEAFETFLKKVGSTKHSFWCGDDTRLKNLNPPGISYGFGNHCKLKASNFKQSGWSISFDVEFNGTTYREVEVALTGKHNALNALAVFGLGLSLGLKENDIRQGLRTFGGVLRRCEKKGESHGILFLDDYAHHPTELRATLKAIRAAIGERRLVVVYQPHRYSRAKECMGMYGDVFREVDHLFVTEIYAANEKPLDGVTHEKIINEIQTDIRKPCLFAERSKIADTLTSFLRPHDAVVTLGAGDITKLSAEIKAKLALKAPKKWKVGVLFGGVSVEHDVSLLSVEHILSSLRPEYYEVYYFGISRQGVWMTGPDCKNRLKNGEVLDTSIKISSNVIEALQQCEVLFPVLHGTNGEDGTVQGFFEVLSKAYVGCDHRSAAICMDKAATKKLMQKAGIPTSPFISFNQHQWKMSESEILKQIETNLTYPLFVKPSHLGSSIGVHKVTEESQLPKAIEDAFRFDTHLVVENGIENAREIEFSVLGNDEITVFPPGEICSGGKIYDYESKYGKNSMGVLPKSEISSELASEGMRMAKKAYQAVGCQGMARVDMFLDPQGKLWLNEINPIPGFTKNSLYPVMCAVNGLKNTDLIDRLIILALQRRRHLDLLEVKP